MQSAPEFEMKYEDFQFDFEKQ